MFELDEQPNEQMGSPLASGDIPSPAVCRPAPAISLGELSPNHIAVVLKVTGEDADVARLKALGVCQGRQVQMVQSGDPMIIRVLGTRIGLAARLAAEVRVQPCHSC